MFRLEQSDEVHLKDDFLSQNDYFDRLELKNPNEFRYLLEQVNTNHFSNKMDDIIFAPSTPSNGNNFEAAESNKSEGTRRREDSSQTINKCFDDDLAKLFDLPDESSNSSNEGHEFSECEDKLSNCSFIQRTNKIKKFTNPAKISNKRAWEVIQNYSNELYFGLDDRITKKVIKAKKNQNCGGRRQRASKIYSHSELLSLKEKDTNPSSRHSGVITEESRGVTKVYPYKVTQKIIRIFKKYFKKLFERYLKHQKITFNREAKRMNKEAFDDHLISFMDEVFSDHLELVEEDLVETIMEALSVLILKNRQNKKEKITDNLNFSEISELLTSSSSNRIVEFFGRKENAFLYCFFFLME
jgi:hypothetical protein